MKFTQQLDVIRSLEGEMGADPGLVEDELVKVGTSSANSPTKEIMDSAIRAIDDKTLALIFISNSYMLR